MASAAKFQGVSAQMGEGALLESAVARASEGYSSRHADGGLRKSANLLPGCGRDDGLAFTRGKTLREIPFAMAERDPLERNRLNWPGPCWRGRFEPDQRGKNRGDQLSGIWQFSCAWPVIKLS